MPSIHKMRQVKFAHNRKQWDIDLKKGYLNESILLKKWIGDSQFIWKKVIFNLESIRLFQNITNQSDINDTRTCDWVEFPAQTPIRRSSPKNPGEGYGLMKGSVTQEDLESAEVRSESEKPSSNPWKSARSPSPVIPSPNSKVKYVTKSIYTKVFTCISQGRLSLNQLHAQVPRIL